MIYYETGCGQLHQGHTLAILKEVSDNIIDCCITSPPYYGLRSYNTLHQIWDDPGDCDHVWADGKSLGHTQQGGDTGQQFCQKCNAWKGSLGLEETPDLFLKHLVQIFNEVKRVLKPTGTLWLNINDSYSGSQTCGGAFDKELNVATYKRFVRETPGVAIKNMLGIPWRLALMMQDNGWYIRQDIIWAKAVSYCNTYTGSVMPESVEDRFTKSYEHIFLFSKKSDYYFDMPAILEHPNTKNERIPRSVWVINPNSIPETHFATFPPKIPEIAIKAGSSAYGCCMKCGAPYKEYWYREKIKGVRKQYWDTASKEEKDKYGVNKNKKINYGWWPTCRCNNKEVIPSIIMDPFAGSGTTLLMAEQLKREWLGIELNTDYCEIIKQQFAQAKYGIKAYGVRDGLFPGEEVDNKLR